MRPPLGQPPGIQLLAYTMRTPGPLIPCILILLLGGCSQGAKDKSTAETAKTTTMKSADTKPADPPKTLKSNPGPSGTVGTDTPPDVAGPPPDAKKTASGLAYKRLKKGTGDGSPTTNSQVEVHYTGWTTDGKMFDSSIRRGRPAKFPLKGVIAGWTEGLQLMKTGDVFRFWIPEALAYQGRKGAPQGMLVFDVELLDFKEPPKPVPAPPDVAAPPAKAKKTTSGLAYLRLEKGTGLEKPSAKSVVRVHYTGWTTDGKMFDSSVIRGQPARFPLNGVIQGWTEGLQLMAPGEKFRFWIPEALAYQGRPGAPKGMLVFDVELLDFK